MLFYVVTILLGSPWPTNAAARTRRAMFLLRLTVYADDLFGAFVTNLYVYIYGPLRHVLEASPPTPHPHPHLHAHRPTAHTIVSKVKIPHLFSFTKTQIRVFLFDDLTSQTKGTLFAGKKIE